MPFDWNAHLRETAQHLLSLASTPGFTEHARHRRDALLADPMYGDALKAEIVRLRSASTSAPAAGSTPASTGAPGAAA